MRQLVSALAATVMCVVAVLVAGCARHPAASQARTTAERSVGARRAATRPSYYLALGDSLAQGVQPETGGASRPGDDGYPDRLYAVLRSATPNLRLVKLGCSGETSFTMIRGGTCHYSAGSQLRTAERFLRAHRHRVSLVTVDIGANDPNSCFLGASLGKLAGCMAARLRLTVSDLRTILAGLRAAGGRRVKIIGMNYYVPELAGWLHSTSGKEIAVLSERLVGGFNKLLRHVYHHYGARVANVFSAFHSGDFTDRVRLPGVANGNALPRNVATICELTWACAPAPRGPNEHANNLGYAIIALAFLLADRR